jgi:hypothetical protein
MWLYRMDGGNVVTWVQPGVAAVVLKRWHRSLASGLVGEVVSSMQRFLRLLRNGQRQQRSSAGLIKVPVTGAEHWYCSVCAQVLC